MTFAASPIQDSQAAWFLLELRLAECFQIVQQKKIRIVASRIHQKKMGGCLSRQLHQTIVKRNPSCKTLAAQLGHQRISNLSHWRLSRHLASVRLDRGYLWPHTSKAGPPTLAYKNASARNHASHTQFAWNIFAIKSATSAPAPIVP